MRKSKNLSPLFDFYWENSKLNEKNILNFLNDFENEDKEKARIVYPTKDIQLSYPKDKLYRVMKNRHSQREYNNYQLNKKELSSLFSCFAEIDSNRLLPSAGGEYPIEIYALCFNVKDLNNKVVYYNYSDNSLSIVCDCPGWNDVREFTGAGDAIKGEPSILFVTVAFPDRVVSKYGERGGRFLLIESGHYIQNLLLRVAYEKLKAVELGGMYDDVIKDMIGLKNTNALITLGVICGK